MTYPTFPVPTHPFGPPGPHQTTPPGVDLSRMNPQDYLKFLPGAPAPDQSALDIVNQTLNSYGLSSLAPWAWSQIVNGSSSSQVLLDLQNQPAFKAAFPEIAAQQAKGLTPMSPGDILAYRSQARQIMQQAGLPQGFWDSPTDFANLIANEVSPAELQERVDLAKQATYGMPQEVRDHLARDYGIDAGHLAANFLDPTQAEPILHRKFLAAQLGGTADQTGYQTTVAQNERLADLGVTQSQAQSGFNQLANSRQLMNALPGENTTGITPDEQLGAVFEGNADAQRKISQRADQRKAVFGGGGQFASGTGGFGGVGSAQGA